MEDEINAARAYNEQNITVCRYANIIIIVVIVLDVNGPNDQEIFWNKFLAYLN